MFLEPEDFQKAFHDIKTTSLSHSTCKLVIYVSCLNIDALCGSKMLSMLLKKHLIPYQLIPVVGYSDLKSHYSKIDEDVTNILLIGCGAMVDIESFLEIDAQEFVKENEFSQVGKRKFKRKLYVIDGHRPWNLDNIFGSEIVTCFDDGHIKEDLTNEKKSYEKLLELQNRDEEKAEEGEEEEAEKSEYEKLSDEDEFEFREDKKSSNKLKKQELLIECEEALETYYSQGTTIITSITAQLYSMISSIGDNEDNIDTLWLSIIGTTSLDYHYPSVYKKLYPLLKDEVIRLNPQSTTGFQRRQNNDANYILIDKDYYLFLLRHWSLYNSFLYSNYVNSKLYLWQEEGRKKLNKMFAKMGISLQIANQSWLYMDIEIKRKLNSIFKKYLGLYDLEDLLREGFVRYFGYKGQISASEYVESLIALLQHDSGDSMNEDNFNFSNPNINDKDEGGDNLLQEDEQNEITKKLVEKERQWVSNFWSSWDALSVNSLNNKKNRSNKLEGVDLIKKGFDIAKDYQQIIFKTGVMIMEKKLLKSLRVFRLVVLKDESISNLGFFKNPLNLTRLGQWILESLAELDNQPLLPLVLAALDLETDTYLVVGLAPLYPRNSKNKENNKKRKSKKKTFKKEKKNKKNGSDKENQNGKEKDNEDYEDEEDEDEAIDLDDEDQFGIDRVLLNTFSVAFQEVTATTDAKVRIDSFESSVIEIRKDDLSPFLEKLTLCGLV